MSNKTIDGIVIFGMMAFFALFVVITLMTPRGAAPVPKHYDSEVIGWTE
jgi:hypothetical protein